MADQGEFPTLETCADLIRAGRLQPAIAALHGILLRARDNAGAELLLADAHGKLGVLEQAVTHARRATELAPNDPRAQGLLAALLLKTGQYEAALAPFEQASRLDPKNAGVWANLGVALHRLGRARQARDAFGKAVSLAPDNPKLRAQLANANQLAGNYDAAIEHYQASTGFPFCRASVTRASQAAASLSAGILNNSLCL